MKRRLMTPGPTQVPEDALLTLSRQVTHHRTPESRALFDRVTRNLKTLFGTEQGTVLLLGGSGTAAMDAAVANTVARGGRALCLVSGKFSERWARLCETYGIEVVEYAVPWGEPFEPATLARLVRDNPDVQAVFTTLCETSTGCAQDICGFSQALDEIEFTPERPRPLLVVDGISAVGAVECRMDAWKIDLLCVGSQKALMGVAGLAVVAVSPRAWQRIETVPRAGFYLDLLRYRKSAADHTTPFTPPKPLVEALDLSVESLCSEGSENTWARTARLAEATRAGLKAMGLTLVARCPSDAMTACRLPESVDAKAFLDLMESRFGVKFAGGQGELSGKIFRMAHFGLIDEFDIIGTLGAVELALELSGAVVAPGAGVAAALSVFRNAP